MKFEAAQLLLAGAGSWFGSALEDLSGKKGGIMLLCSVALLSIAGTAAAMATFGDWRSIPRRVEVLEQWRIVHTDTVTTPALERVDDLEFRQGATTAQMNRIESMLYRIYCADYPEECDGVPR